VSMLHMQQLLCDVSMQQHANVNKLKAFQPYHKHSFSKYLN